MRPFDHAITAIWDFVARLFRRRQIEDMETRQALRRYLRKRGVAK